MRRENAERNGGDEHYSYSKESTPEVFSAVEESLCRGARGLIKMIRIPKIGYFTDSPHVTNVLLVERGAPLTSNSK
ncbi:hypothetical protein TNCV_3493841 [Trichonephila clavipes]|nr:hypothetical protein TNCV_3493841 [Trichonephila clavipes]